MDDIQRHEAAFEEASSLLNEVKQRLFDESTDLTFPNYETDTDGFYCGLIYMRLLEIGASLSAVCSSGELAGAPILLRALIDSHVDLRGLAKGITSFDDLLYRECIAFGQMRQLFIDLQQEPPVTEDKVFLDACRFYKKEKKRLEQSGYKEEGIKQRILKAGLDGILYALYRECSADAHSSLSVLERRHVLSKEQEDDTVRLELMVFSKNELPRAFKYTHGASALLVDSRNRLVERLGWADAGFLATLMQKISSLPDKHGLR